MMQEMPRTFEELWTAWYGKMLTYTREFHGLDLQDREELVHDIMLKIWNNRAKFNATWALSTWFYRVARNLCIDRQRKCHRISQRHVPLDERDHKPRSLPPGPCAFEPEQLVLAREEASRVRLAIEGLSQLDREVLFLIYSENLCIRELAQVLEIPEGTIKSRLSRARIKLRTVLEAES